MTQWDEDRKIIERASEPEWIYGYGRTKHIHNPAALNHMGEPPRRPRAWCGAYGGHAPAPSRPTCKTCLRLSGIADPLAAALERIAELETGLRDIALWCEEGWEPVSVWPAERARHLLSQDKPNG